MAARKRRAARGRKSAQGIRTKAGFMSAEIAEADIPDYVVAELRYEAPVAFSARRFAAPEAAAPQADSLNRALGRRSSSATCR